MENLPEEEKKESKKPNKNLMNIILCSFLTLVLGGLLGFFIGTKNGINTGRKVAMQYLEYMVAKPTSVDLSVIKSEPAAVYGDENALVHVKYFSDIQCPSCVTMFEESISYMAGNDKFMVEIYDFPFAEHRLSRLASKYARCAVKQGVDYMNYMEKLMTEYDQWSSMLKESNVSEYLLKTSVDFGADEDTMNLCVIGDEVNEAIEANIADGLSLGVKGTPAYTIGNGLIQGYVSPETLERIIQDSLKPAPEKDL